MAQRHWVGGTNTWNATAGTKWALTNGGVGGQAVPTATDDVFFDSGSGNVTITITTAACQSLDCTGFTGTITGTGVLSTITGVFKLSSGMAGCTYTGTITFTGTSGTSVLTSAGFTLGSITISGLGGTVQLADNLLANSSTAKTVSLNGGTFDTNGKNWTTGLFASSNSAVRTLTFTSGICTLQGTGTVWSTLTTTNLTINKGGTIKCTDSSATACTVTCGSVAVGPIQKTAGSGIFTLTLVVCDGLDFTGYSGAWAAANITVHGNITLGSGTPTAGNNLITWGVTSGTAILTSNGIILDRPITVDGVGGTHQIADTLDINARTLTLTNGTLDFNNKDYKMQILSSSNSNTRSILWGTGAGTLRGTGTVLDFTTATGLTTTAQATGSISVTDASATGKTIQGGSVFIPNLKKTAGTDTFTTTTVKCRGLDFTGFTGTWSPPITVKGNLVLVTGMTLSNNNTLIMDSGASGTVTITTNGKIVDCPMSIQGDHAGSGVVQLSDDLTLSVGRTLTHKSGGFDSNGKTISLDQFTYQDADTASLTLGGSTWLVLGTADAWNIQATANLTFSAGTSTIKLTGTLGDVIFDGGGLTYNKVWDAITAANKFIVTGSNTFNDFRRDAGSAHTIQFTAGTTNTFTTFSVNGAAGNLITIQSDTAATHTLTKVGGGVISCDYLAIDHSTATPGSTWYAGAHSTDNGNNSGWIFTVPPTGSFRRNPNLDGLSVAGSFFANPLAQPYQPHATNDNEQRIAA